MEKRKLGFNTTTGIINIIVGIIGLIGFFALMGIASDISGLSNIEILDNPDIDSYIDLGKASMYAIGWILSIVSIVLSIISIVMSRKNGISIVGPILALVGGSLTLISIGLLAIVTAPLMIAGGIVGLIQKNTNKNNEVNDEVINQGEYNRGYDMPSSGEKYNNSREEFKDSLEEKIEYDHLDMRKEESKIESASEEEWKL